VDRYGAAASAFAATEHRFPDREEAAATVRHLALQCPECGVSDWPELDEDERPRARARPASGVDGGDRSPPASAGPGRRPVDDHPILGEHDGRPREVRLRASLARRRLSRADRPPLAARRLARASPARRMGQGPVAEYRAPRVVWARPRPLRGVPPSIHRGAPGSPPSARGAAPGTPARAG
jgi:hypothetical protein